jgi:hypothetical protein
MTAGQKFPTRYHGFIKLLGYLTIAALPLLASMILVRTQLHSRLSDFQPAWSDEVIYWHSINTFKEVGIHGGYFTFEEILAKSGQLQFGTHGAAFSLLYGSVARVVGWNLSSGPLFNAVFIGLFLFAVLWLIQPDTRRAVLIALLVAMSFPLLFYLPTTMQESLNQGFAILVAAFLICLARGKTSRWAFKLLAVLTVFIASLFRITWVLAFPPILYFSFTGAASKRWLKVILFSLVLAFASYIIFSWWTSPYPDWFFFNVLGRNIPLVERLSALLGRIGENLAVFFSVNSQSNLVEIILRFQFLLVMLLMFILLRKNVSLSLATIFLFATHFVAVVALYDVKYFRDFRFLSPILLFGLIMLIELWEYQGMAKWLPALLAVAFMLPYQFYFSAYQMHLNEFVADSAVPPEDYRETLANLQYWASSDPWCNSLLVDQTAGESLKLLPAGIGLNVLLEPSRLLGKVNSHYVFVSRETIEKLGMQETCRALFQDDIHIICERTDDTCTAR